MGVCVFVFVFVFYFVFESLLEISTAKFAGFAAAKTPKKSSSLIQLRAYDKLCDGVP